MASTYCACRDCFDIATTEDNAPALCLECEDAGCAPNDGDCQRPEAYEHV